MKGEMIMNDTRNLDNEIEEIRELMEKVLDSEDYRSGQLYCFFDRAVNLPPERILQATSLEELYAELETREKVKEILEGICKTKRVYWKRLKAERKTYQGCLFTFTAKEIKDAESLEDLQWLAREKLDNKNLVSAIAEGYAQYISSHKK